MKTKLIILSILTAVAAGNANAEEKIICRGTSQSSGEPFAVEITSGEVTVRGGLLTTPHIFNNLTKVNGLITAPGLAIAYGNDYGCIRRATIITELEQPFGAGYVETNYVATCSGGSTPDQLCKPSN
jgi:hypothetical protein